MYNTVIHLSLVLVILRFKTAFILMAYICFYILEFFRNLTKSSLHQPLVYGREHKAGYVGEGSLFAN